MRHAAWSVPLLSGSLGLLLAASSAASVGPPLTIDALSTASDMVVIGRVETIASALDPSVDSIYTYVTIQPSDILKGPAIDGPIVVKQLGGLVGTRGLRVPGQPTFAEGEDVLLFLVARPRDGTLRTIGLWQGKWEIAYSSETVALKREPETGAVVASYAIDDLRRRLEALGFSGRRSSATVNVAPVEQPRDQAPFVLNDPPIRWMQPVVPLHIEFGSQPGLAGGGATEIGGAAAQWNAVGGSVSIQGAARQPQRCQSSTGSDMLVTFNDPCGEISNDPGVLAIAAFGFTTTGAQTINGRLYRAITDAVITTSSNPAARPTLISSTRFQSTIAHEIGHALGLDHSPDPTALMYFQESGSCFQAVTPVGPDDRAGFLTIYPGSGAPPPTPPPPTGTPGQATVTSASATGGVLNIAWTLAAAAAPTSHRLDFFSGAAMVASLTVGAATSTAIPIPPGTQGSFTVRVTALTGATAGPTSAAFPFTLGGGGGGGGGGGCTSAPAAPVVTGSLVAGTASVSWALVSGATSYLVSAGSTQGGTNLYPPTNVGAGTSVGANGLPAGFTAWVRVIAINPCGQSAPTDFFLSSGTTPQPTPPPTPTPPPPGSGSIRWATEASTCSCWSNPISLQIDGGVVGSMSCTGSAGPFPVAPGTHSYRSCDAQGCTGNTTDVTGGATLTVTLRCQ